MTKLFKKTIFIFTILIIAFNNCSYAQEQVQIMPIKLTDKIVFDTVPLNLEEIANTADRVFAGICTGKEDIQNDPASQLNVMKYTFEISESIRGNNQSTISFKQWKPTTKDAGYEVGKRYIVFLYPDSEIGLTSPVGFQQGQFFVEKKGLGRGIEYIRNSRNNSGLYRNLRTQKKISIKNDKLLDSYINECSETGKPIKYNDFVRAVRFLIKE